ncbi:MAG: cytochrome b/b6 domain-containing protein [Phenylobacterium sp.]|nr:cytochrome b/b6 domain-containing protein [Phenylobacterium sp.]
MSPDPASSDAEAALRPGPWTRLTHALIAASVFLLLPSGLQIFNAHPALYTGEVSRFDSPWLEIGARERGEAMEGYLRIGGREFETTGVLGWSGPPGEAEKRAFPAWTTLPGYRSLATGRNWHLAAAWGLGLGLAAYLVAGLAGGRLRRSLVPTRAMLAPRAVLADLAAHLTLRLPEAGGYNLLQRLAYLGVVVLVLPAMIVSGLAMSPAVHSAAPWTGDIFGGRQSARSAHFLGACLLVLFIGAHLFMLLLHKPLRRLRGMTLGERETRP